MENIPCSHVGHVYRNFDRFAVDPSLDNVDVGKALNRNDMRVAEVWLDEYKALFYQARGLAGMDTFLFILFVCLKTRRHCVRLSPQRSIISVPFCVSGKAAS